jgi:predicted cobalt transporter CbtA
VQIDWSFLEAVNWTEVAWLSAITFLATLIGNILIFRHWFWAAILAGILFAAGYLFLAYYPHERPVPGLKRVAASPAPALMTSLPPVADTGQPRVTG